jgi:uncharacterized membrane protein YphA (DoxX/SURF4 family)
MRSLFLIGRALFGGYFAYSGLKHFTDERKMSQYAAYKGVPAPDVAVQASGALLLSGGLSVLAGVKPHQGLAAIVAFLVPVTLQMHRFWEIGDEQQRTNEMINFTKNFALVGAAMMLTQIPEPWPATVDYARDEEMYIRFGNRDLTALPV